MYTDVSKMHNNILSQSSNAMCKGPEFYRPIAVGRAVYVGEIAQLILKNL